MSEFSSKDYANGYRDGAQSAEATITALRAEVERLREMQRTVLVEQGEDVASLRAENEKMRAALGPFADMGRAMMGRKHHNEAVVQYSLAPTIKVHHLVAAYNALKETSDE